MTYNYNYQTIDLGSGVNSLDGDRLRDAMDRVNDNKDLTVANFMLAQTAIEAIPAKTTREFIRDYDLGEECDYPFFGGTNDFGDWLIRNLRTTNETIVYANANNNPTIGTFADAWAARNSLTYYEINDLTITR